MSAERVPNGYQSSWRNTLAQGVRRRPIMKVLMPCAQEIYGELRAEERDDYLGTAPVYMILRGEQVVGYVFWDGDSESWRYGQSPLVDEGVSLNWGSTLLALAALRTAAVKGCGGRDDAASTVRA